MSATSIGQSHIAYELIDDTHPEVVVIEFLSREIVGTGAAREFGEQLDSLISPAMPRTFVIDFANVRALGSSAFAELVSFARRVRRLSVCNMRNNLRLGASLIGLDECAEFAVDRAAAIDSARNSARPGEQDTVDYPVLSD